MPKPDTQVISSITTLARFGQESFAVRSWGKYGLEFNMESVPKELRNLRACLLCSLVKVGNFSEWETCLDFCVAIYGITIYGGVRKSC